MTTTFQLLDDNGTLVWDFNDPTGDNNPFSIRTALTHLDLSVPVGDLEMFEGDLPGGLLVTERDEITSTPFRFRVRHDDVDERDVALGQLAHDLRNCSRIRYVPMNSTRTRHLRYLYASTPALIRGQSHATFWAYDRIDDPEGLPVVLIRQPTLAGPTLSSDDNLLQNALLLFAASSGVRPESWEWDDDSGISGEQIDDDGYAVSVAGAGPFRFEQVVEEAEAGEQYTLSVYASGSASGRVRMVFLDAADAELSTVQSALTPFPARLSLTEETPPATAKIRAGLVVEDSDEKTARFFGAQLQQGPLTSLVANSATVSNSPDKRAFVIYNPGDAWAPARLKGAARGAGTMLVNTFTGANGTLLDAHPPDLGDVPTALNFSLMSSFGTITAEINGDRARSTSDTNASRAYRFPGVFGDCDVSADFVIGAANTTDHRWALAARMSPTGTSSAAVDCYIAGYFGDPTASTRRWFIAKQINDTRTELASLAEDLHDQGVTRRARFSVRGNVLRLLVLEGGVWVTKVTVTDDDLVGGAVGLSTPARTAGNVNFIDNLEGTGGTRIERVTLGLRTRGQRAGLREAKAYDLTQAELFGSGMFRFHDGPVVADAGAWGGQAVRVGSASHLGRIARVVVPQDQAEALRGGTYAAMLRVRTSSAMHLQVQGRWDFSHTDRPAHSDPLRSLNTTGMTSHRYVEIPLSSITVPETPLEGCVFEIWARVPTTHAFFDSLVFVPTDQASAIVAPQSHGESWLGSDLVTPTQPPGLTGGTNDGTAKVLSANGQACGTPPVEGIPFGAGRHRVAFRISWVHRGATSQATFRVRNISPSADVVTRTISGAELDSFGDVVSVEWDGHGSGDVQPQVVLVTANNSTLTVHSIAYAFIPALEDGEAFVTDPSLQNMSARKLSAAGNVLQDLGAGGPVPFWVPPGLSILVASMSDARHQGTYPELLSVIDREMDLSYEIDPAHYH